MKIEINVFYQDGYECQEMKMDGKEIMSVYPLCESPEDAIIGRSLIAPTEVLDLMKKAYNAGKTEEDFYFKVNIGE